MRILILLLLCASTTLHARTPAQILRDSGIPGGMVVHLGCCDGSETVKLGENPGFCVQGLAVGDVSTARQTIRNADCYGRVSAVQLHGSRLPYAENLINVLFADDPQGVTRAEIMRVLAPLGKAYIREGNEWKETVKPWPQNMDQWTHYLRGPDNNAVTRDPEIGAPRSLRWVSYPRWGRSHEEMASMSTAVSADGRLFYINDESPLASIRYLAERKLVARDAFNGTKLWERPVSNWVDHLRHFRSGPSHLSRRLVAVGDKVFVTLGLDAPLTCLDAATGKEITTYKGTEYTEEIVHNSDGRLYLMVGTSERVRKGGGLFERNEPEPSENRDIVVLDEKSGKVLWKKNAKEADYVMPLSLTVKGDRVYYHTIRGLHCADAATGKEHWLAPKPAVATRYGFSTSTLVVTEDVILLADRIVETKAGPNMAAQGDVSYAVHGWNENGFDRKSKSEMTAYAAGDGKELWRAPCSEGYNSPVDVFVAGDIVWLGLSFSKGYNLRTGEVVRELNVKGDPVGMAHHRCYRNKATLNTILTGFDGIETIDMEKGWTGNNSWVRGTCQYGILPANGLIYAPPNACACHPKVKMQGLVALSAELPASAKKELPPAGERLIKGPAFPRLSQLASQALPADSWPLYRCDAMRGGSGATTVEGTGRKWEARPGGRLTQAVSAGGRVYVASTDSHTVHALNASDGKTIWTFTAGGRIDSAPSLCRGLIVFGSADGWVYALDSSSGAEAWRFRAAPEVRLISVFGQLESAWPVHGSVLVQNDEIHFTAGRNSYLDGGISLYRMNPVTCEVLAATPIRHLDPLTGKQTGKEGRKAGLGFDSEGTVSDILSGDGTSVFLKHMRFDAQGREQPPTVPHLFCQTGLLGEESFVRSYWVFGTDVGAGWGGWATMINNDVRAAPSGRILAFDDKELFGYGRVQPQAAAVGHRADATHLYASAKEYGASAPEQETQAGKAKKPTGKKQAAKSFKWSNTDPFTARAMALTSDKLYIAGVPDAGEKDTKNENILQFTNNEEALEAFRGERGAYLKIVSRSDGTVQSEIKLDAPPVFDGISAAEGKLFASLKNGTLVCFGD